MNKELSEALMHRLGLRKNPSGKELLRIKKRTQYRENHVYHFYGKSVL